MKKVLLISFLFLINNYLYSQDTIRLLNGNYFVGKVLNVSETDIILQQSTNKVEILNRTETEQIIYSNGIIVKLNSSPQLLIKEIKENIYNERELKLLINNINSEVSEVAYYYYLKNGYAKMTTEQKINDFIKNYPKSKYIDTLKVILDFNLIIYEIGKPNFIWYINEDNKFYSKYIRHDEVFFKDFNGNDIEKIKDNIKEINYIILSDTKFYDAFKENKYDITSGLTVSHNYLNKNVKILYFSYSNHVDLLNETKHQKYDLYVSQNDSPKGVNEVLDVPFHLEINYPDKIVGKFYIKGSADLSNYDFEFCGKNKIGVRYSCQFTIKQIAW